MANTTVSTGAAKEIRERLYTVVEAAKILRLSPNTIRMYCYLGMHKKHDHHGVRLECLKFGQTYMIPHESIEEYKRIRKPLGRPKGSTKKRRGGS